MKFQVHNKETAGEVSSAILANSEKSFGFIPNIHGVLAESPAALQSYTSIGAALSHCALTAVEQQVVFLAVSAESGCTYCVAAHSMLAQMATMPETHITELREQKALSDAKLNALRDFALSVVENRGWVPEQETEAFQAAGFDQQHILDVITIIAMKTISNFTNHFAHTALDSQFADRKWETSKG